MTRSFGAPTRGQTFEWTWVDDDGVEHTETFRAKPYLLFDEHLAYKAKQSRTSVIGQATFNRQVEQLKAIEIDGSTESEETLERIANEALEGEKARWEMVVELTLMLVADEDQPRLEPLLHKTTLAAIGELRKWLQEVVIDGVIDEVQAVEHVDPTSPEPPTTP